MFAQIFSWICSKENITFVIAVAGFILSLWNFFFDLWRNRCALSVEYINHYCGIHPNGNGLLQLRLNIVNESSAPIAVSRMFLLHNGKEIEFLFPSLCVWEFTKLRNGQIMSQDEVKSQAIPFKIEGHGVVGGYFLVYVPREELGFFEQEAEIQLVLQTARRKKRFLLTANNPGRDAEQYGKK